MENDVIHIDVEKSLVSANGNITLQVNTSIDAGEFVTLFGTSGAGKTTLLRILAGLQVPDRGTISFGNVIWFDSAKGINVPPQRRNIGFMFQDYALFPNMTVKENIRFAQEVHNESYTCALLDNFGLSEFANRKPLGLSGGQKQRVALARALARKPSLLLLDEPLSALDATMRPHLQDEIIKAHALTGATTILVSHDVNEVFRLSTHVLCLDDGKITNSGKPASVFSNTSISGKFQIVGQIANIERQDIVNIITVVTGNNTIVKVIDMDDSTLKEGDRVLVFTKAFNPFIQKIVS
jgi:molybdate transport system ATP-binding protein